jgi:amino acid transporter
LRAGIRATRYGTPTLFYLGIAAVTPLTVIVGGQSLGFGQVQQLGTPIGYTIAALMLGVFAVGVAAMARHVPNSGAFYSYVTAGLGKPLGTATAGVALLAYNAMQIGLYGAFGVAATTALRVFGVPGWWSLWAMLGWAAITVLGQLRIRTNAVLVAVLVAAEILLVLVLDVVMVAHPADGVVRFDALNPELLATTTGLALLVGCITGLVGFEIPLAFAPLALDPRRTTRRAIGWILLVVAVLYTGSGWAMTVTAGPDRIIGIAGQHLTDLFFHLPAAHLPQPVITAGLVLYATSLFAAMLAFHTTVARYTLTLAREGVLPGWLAVTRADEVPVTASLTQSGLAFTTLTVVVLVGGDPTMDLFFFGTVSGGLGVLTLMTLTAVAVIVFFGRRRRGETWWRARIAPVLSAAALLLVLAVSVAFFGDLLGTTDPVRTWAAPVAYLSIAVAGIGWAQLLKHRQPEVYAVIGHGDRTHHPATPGSTPRHNAYQRVVGIETPAGARTRRP